MLQSEKPMPTVSFELAEDQLRDLGTNPAEATRKLRLAAAFHLCGRGQLSTGKAARLAGISYTEFLEEAVRQKVDLYQYDIEDIKEEVTRPLPSDIDFEAIKQSILRAQSADS